MKTIVKILCILTGIGFFFIPGIFELTTIAIIVSPFAFFPFVFGFDDGWMKLYKTEHHIAKYPLYVLLGYFTIIDFDWLTLLGWVLIYKPLFDYGWTFGNGKRKLFIGTTEYWDKIIRKLGLFKERGFSWIIPIYFFSVTSGYFLIMHQSRGMYEVVLESIRCLIFG